MSTALPQPDATPARRLITEVERTRRERPDAAWQRIASDFAKASRSASPRERGELWRLRGHVLRGLRRASEAAEAYRAAEHHYATARDRRERGRCAIGWVDALLYLGRYREAMRVAAAGRRHLEAVGDGVSLGRLLNNEANVLHRLDLPERALARYREARASLGRLGDRYERAQMGVNVGNCLSLLGRCGPARTAYREAERAAAAANRPLDQLRAAYNLAYLDFLEHRYEAALDALGELGERSRGMGYPSIAALARLDRAEILLRLGAHAEAFEESRAALEACGTLSLRYERAKAETFAALAAFRLGRARDAAARLERALDEFHAEGNAVWMGETLVGLATLWWRDRQPRAAAVLIEAAALHFVNARDREREGCARALAVRAHLAAGNRAGAARARRRLRAITGKARSPRLRPLAASAEAAWARANGDVAAARRALERAAIESERLAARILDEQWRASFWGEWGWPHRALAALEAEHGRYAEALEALERGRGRALLGAEAGAERANRLAGSVRSWAASRYARDRERSTRGAVTTALETHERPREDRRGTAAPRALDRRPAGRMEASRIQRALPEGALLLDYLFEDERLSVIVAGRDRIAGRTRIADESRLAAQVQGLLFSLRSAAFGPRGAAESRAFEEGLERLAASVLWPALEAWGERPASLAIAPTGPLARVPWAALPLPDGRRLCQAMPLVLVPGLRLTLGERARPDRARGTGAPLVVAADAGELGEVGEEVRAIAALHPEAVVLEGREATVRRFLELSPAAPWIHFAGHGVYRPESPYGSGLQLADGWLSASHLVEARLTADRIVLAACQSARALVRPGEEWLGLARTLLRGGARQVVASQWDVEDEATRRLMTDFYARLGAAGTPARALAAAQSGMAESGTHGLDWAGFVVLGGPDRLQKAGDA